MDQNNTAIAIPETLVSLEESQRMAEATVIGMLRDPRYRRALLATLAELGIKPCDGACSTGTGTLPAMAGECTSDTRLSYSRKTNLMRLDGDEFNFKANMPIQPGQSQTYVIPPFKLGRVIECFYFRPKMAENGNPDDIQVVLTGDDGVFWKKFRGGRHMSNGCCLLECFKNDCIGWDEGFRVILTHEGAQGAPPLVSAAADWNYLFETSQSKIIPDWCWPKGCSKGKC